MTRDAIASTKFWIFLRVQHYFPFTSRHIHIIDFLPTPTSGHQSLWSAALTQVIITPVPSPPIIFPAHTQVWWNNQRPVLWVLDQAAPSISAHVRPRSRQTLYDNHVRSSTTLSSHSAQNLARALVPILSIPLTPHILVLRPHAG